ncbi:pseudaminic acid synthase [Eubacterium limosum]|uniref:Pseudaminic acid synthase n=1 Tax=Eubacterium limosum TaxID=1736 RepID=A0ABT5UU29_EUBLI|nr:pseudaminic acid synthase [Eubacterium limosum]MCB6569828.1 pseudaminic acid synthase [Eubacterium limosum]MDE1471007.1 pseudaminic acid synthase [Eubacterium limosum]
MRLLEKMQKGEVYTIAEMSANHAGNLDYALKTVEAAKNAGADCLKIQTYTADTMTINCDNDYFKIKDGMWEGYTLYDLYSEASMPWEWQGKIKEKCDQVGIDFLSTPFDQSSVDFLENLGVEFYKVASFELVDIPLIEYIASKGKPMIISTGMGSVEEIEDAVNVCKSQGNEQIVLLKCSSEYPASYEDMNLLTIVDMQKRFGVTIGLSDHSMGSLAPVVAVALGAQVIEKHFCVDRAIKTADSSFSMMPDEFKQMVEDVQNVQKIRGAANYQLSEKEKCNLKFRRSVFTVKDIDKGEYITGENTRVIRPGYGIKPIKYKEVLGKKTNVKIKRGTPVAEEWVDE